MDIKQIYQDDSSYPFAPKKYLADDAPKDLSAIGDIILKTYDLMCQLRDAGVTVIGGFHSPMERECLNILLRGKQPIVICPARNIEKMKIKGELRKPLEDARVLILSPFSEMESRITTERADRRNRFIAAMADAVFVAHAEPGGKTEQLCREIFAWNKPLYTTDSNANNNLLSMAVITITKGTVLEWMTASKPVLNHLNDKTGQ